jgi:hypothetical protein
MGIKRIANNTQIVTHFSAQQSPANEHVDLRFAYLEHQAAQALPPAFPM